MAAVDTAFIQWFQQAIRHIDEIDRSDREQGRRFNLFRLLQIERAEVQTHSRLIAALLDPNGSHGQGPLFLESFLRHFADRLKPMLGLELTGKEAWRVITEESHRDVAISLDIALRCTKPRVVIVIENKVDAAERENQCADYLKYLRDHERGASALLYLTPEGREADSLQNRENEYARISYEDIANWIDLVADECPEAVCSTLGQYSQLARLIGDGAEWVMSDEHQIIDFLEREENLRYALRIASAMDGVREKRIKAFFDHIETAARDRLETRGRAWRKVPPELSRPRPYMGLSLDEEDPLYASVQLDGPSSRILYGICWADKRPKGDQVPQEAAALHAALEKAMGKEASETDDWWLWKAAQPGDIDEVCLQPTGEGSLAQDLGHQLGELMAAVESELRKANAALKRSSKGR